MKTNLAHRTALVIVAIAAIVHAALAYSFAVRTPFYTPGVLLGQRDPATGGPQAVGDVGAPDERQHVNYAVRLAKHEGLPVFNPGATDLYETYQSHQPPLFYALVSPVIPQEPTPSNGLAYRWPNFLFGALTIVALFYFGRNATGREEVGVALSLIACGWPMLCALSGAFSNDPLLILMITCTFASLAAIIRWGATPKRTVAAAVFIALGCLTKTTALVLFPLALLALLMAPERSARAWLATLPAFLVPLPIWIRNVQLYGDPFALKAFGQAFVGSAQKATILQVIQATTPNVPAETSYWINWIGWWSFRSLIGVFGYMDIWLNERTTAFSEGPNTLYRVLLVLFLVAAAGAIWQLRSGLSPDSKRVAVLAGVGLLLFVLVFVNFNNTYFQAQGRYVLPAIAPLSLALLFGLQKITRLAPLWVGVAIGVLMLGISTYALGQLPAEFSRRVEIVAPGS